MMMQMNTGAPQKVMPGLVSGIHDLRLVRQGVDGRDKPGHDDLEALLLAHCDDFSPMGRGEGQCK
jgi:hypothetical protein